MTIALSDQGKVHGSFQTNVFKTAIHSPKQTEE